MKKNIKDGYVESTPLWELETDPFITVYNELRQVLHHLGYSFPHKHRFEVFRLYLQLQRDRAKIEPDSSITWPVLEAFDQALFLVEEMTQLKIHGMEPEHKNGYYT